MVAVRIMPAKLAATVKSEEFNSGKAMIGTGPYKFKEYVAGDRVVLERNDAYWGAKPHWKTVRMRDDHQRPGTRGGLLAGDVADDRGRPHRGPSRGWRRTLGSRCPRRSATGSFTCTWTATAR